jgi:lipopolysaccharide/colanic/teichoic acid biosynthesis glycosyltransferase
MGTLMTHENIDLDNSEYILAGRPGKRFTPKILRRFRHTMPSIANSEVYGSTRQGRWPIRITSQSFGERSIRRSLAGTRAGGNTHRLKRPIDLIGATTAVVVLSPLLVGIAVAIKANSKGPVFFLQNRHGKDGKVFKVLKFRSMYVEKCDHSGVRQTVKDDPRITPVGRFLRRSNFDELPQLINVLRGEMSLVGPRPHVPGMLAAGVPYEEFDRRYHARHSVRPGITGLAQVNGFRGETKNAYAARMRLKYDLVYTRQQSAFLDIKIMAGTVLREFFSRNGY